MCAGTRSLLASLCLLRVCFGSLLLLRLGLWLLWNRPLDGMREVDTFGSDPFVETFVELLIMHVKGRLAFSRGYGKDFCLAVFAVLGVQSAGCL